MSSTTSCANAVSGPEMKNVIKEKSIILAALRFAVHQTEAFAILQFVNWMLGMMCSFISSFHVQIKNGSYGHIEHLVQMYCIC